MSKIWFKNMTIEFFVDKENETVHLLECNPTHFSKLPNVIGPEFQNDFIEKNNLSTYLNDFKWICYAPNGPILTYFWYNLSLTSKKDKTLYEPFLSVSEGM